MALQYRIYYPDEKFRPYINNFWTIDSTEYEPDYCESIYPTGCIELFFHYGDRFKSNFTGEKQPILFLCGQKSKLDKVESYGYSGVIVCNFKPYGAKQFFNIPMNEISEINFDLTLLFGYEIEFVKEKLFEAKNNIQRVQIIQKFLEKNFLEKEEYDIRRIGKSVDYFQNLYPITIDELAEYSNLSIRQLQRKYLKYIGLSPKLLSRIIRFNKARVHIENKISKLTETAYLLEYYDQAHLIHDFKEFMGMTPSEYLKVYQKIQI